MVEKYILIVLISCWYGVYGAVIPISKQSNAGDPCIIPGDPENNTGLYAPNPSKCSQFLVCDNGIFRDMDCPDGLHWNADAFSCDLPQNANCTATSVEPPTLPTITTPPFTTNSPPTPPTINPSTTTSLPDTTITPPLTTDVPPPPTTDFPPPPTTDVPLPPTTDAPPTTSTTVIPSSSTVIPPNTSTEPDTTVTITNPPPTTIPPNQPWTPPNVNYTSCPPIDPLEYTVILPHPHCSLFYMCDNGVPRERPCPTGLEWNAQIWTCDWPESAQCVEGAAPEQPNAVPLNLEYA